MATQSQSSTAGTQLQTPPSLTTPSSSRQSHDTASATPPNSLASQPPDPSSPQIQHSDNRARADSLGGATLVPSPSPSPSPSPPNGAPPAPSSVHTSGDNSQSDSQKPVGFWSKVFSKATKAKAIMAFGVCAMTVAAVVYAWRADYLSKWDAYKEYYEWCQGAGANYSKCSRITAEPLRMPPLHSIDRFLKKVQKRALVVLRSRWETSAEPSHRHRLGIPIAALGGSILLIFTLLVVVVVWHFRQQQRRERISDQSMARADHSNARPWLQHSPNKAGADGLRQRYRAFVTAEKAINSMKSSSANTSQSSLQDSYGRSSSNPWDRRKSWLTNSNPSALDGADVVLYDAEHEDEPWQKVRRLSKDRTASSLTLSSPPSELHSPPRKLPIANSEDDTDEDQPPMSKLKRWLSPGHVKVLANPAPELHQGDSEAAVAMIGAGLAATTGGRAMARCPVEVPLDADSRLPDSWMHTSPQDESIGMAVPVH